MKVIGYARVSTEEQATQGHSLGAQEAKLRQYCDLYGHDLVEVIIDAGQSAKTLDRPGLTRALASLEGGAAEGLVILKLDRLTRSVRDLGTLLEDYFQRFALLSVLEQCDTSTASGRLILNLLMSVSQWERETIGERTSAALQHKKAMGAKLGAPALDDPAALAEARRLRAAGLTLRQVAEEFTAQGRQTLKGGRWQATTIKRLLERGADAS